MTLSEKKLERIVHQPGVLFYWGFFSKLKLPIHFLCRLRVGLGLIPIVTSIQAAGCGGSDTLP